MKKHIISLSVILFAAGIFIYFQGCSKESVSKEKNQYNNTTNNNTPGNVENITPPITQENKVQSSLTGKPEHLTNATFKQKVFNYEVNKTWKYEGDVPAIVDFYADWCAPCKRIAPIMEELAKEYDGKIKIYKVDTEQEQQLAAAFGIQSIPSLLFIPMNGQPQMAMGAMPKEDFEKAINEFLLK